MPETIPFTSSEAQRRALALELAVRQMQADGRGEPRLAGERTVVVAEQYLAFLEGRSAVKPAG